MFEEGRNISSVHTWTCCTEHSASSFMCFYSSLLYKSYFISSFATERAYWFLVEFMGGHTRVQVYTVLMCGVVTMWIWSMCECKLFLTRLPAGDKSYAAVNLWVTSLVVQCCSSITETNVTGCWVFRSWRMLWDLCCSNIHGTFWFGSLFFYYYYLKNKWICMIKGIDVNLKWHFTGSQKQRHLDFEAMITFSHC